jgi:hypothetical protein
VPEGGYFVNRSRTNRLLILGRAFLENKNDPMAAERDRIDPLNLHGGQRDSAGMIVWNWSVSTVRGDALTGDRSGDLSGAGA